MAFIGEKSMSWIEGRAPYLLIILFGLIILAFSIWDIVYNKEWRQQILAAYMILIILSLVLLVVRPSKPPEEITESIKEFEKMLHGKLYHFQCQNCKGIFAVKKSKRNNKKRVRLTCPDCGSIGVIPSKPKSIKSDIPPQKSLHVVFKCAQCEEKITMWAEGAELHQDVNIFSCPYCGKERTMKRI